jgi:hypothetical protein
MRLGERHSQRKEGAPVRRDEDDSLLLEVVHHRADNIHAEVKGVGKGNYLLCFFYCCQLDIALRGSEGIDFFQAGSS